MAELLFHKLDHEVSDFSCGNGSIDLQIRNAYWLCLQELEHTFEIKTNDGRVLGYFCLKMKRIKKSALPEEIGDVETGYEVHFFAVEVKFLAIDRDYQRLHIGASTLGGIIELLREYHKMIPFRFIYIDALNELVGWYQRVGFAQLPEGSTNQITTPMYYDLNENQTKIEEYFMR